MSQRRAPRGFAARPSDPEAWVRAPGRVSPSSETFTARLTIDVTPTLRGRIKVTAFERGLTVADMLRALLAREYLTREALTREALTREDLAAADNGGAS